MTLPTDTEMLDWIAASSGGILIERHYQPLLSARTEEENRSGGYNSRIDFFSVESQYLTDVPSLREAIATAMLIDAEMESAERHNVISRTYARRLKDSGREIPSDLRKYSSFDWSKSFYTKSMEKNPIKDMIREMFLLSGINIDRAGSPVKSEPDRRSQHEREECGNDRCRNGSKEMP